MNKFKGKFEAKEEEVLPIAHGVHIKKKVMPQALQFQMNEKKEEKEKDKVSKVSVGSTVDWAWKKKDPNQLAAEMALSGLGPSAEKLANEKLERLVPNFHIFIFLQIHRQITQDARLLFSTKEYLASNYFAKIGL